MSTIVLRPNSLLNTTWGKNYQLIAENVTQPTAGNGSYLSSSYNDTDGAEQLIGFLGMTNLGAASAIDVWFYGYSDTDSMTIDVRVKINGTWSSPQSVVFDTSGPQWFNLTFSTSLNLDQINPIIGISSSDTFVHGDAVYLDTLYLVVTYANGTAITQAGGPIATDAISSASINGNRISSSNAYEEVGSGGSLGGSAAILFVSRDIIAIGGTLGGGTGFIGNDISFMTSGGALGGGTSFYGEFETIIGYGGLTGGGSDVDTVVLFELSSGGGLSSGAVFDTVILFEKSSGGGLVSGSNFITENVLIVGGVVCGGDNIAIKTFDVIGSGGVVCGGDNALLRVLNVVTAGGGLVGSSAVTLFIYNHIASGGIIIGANTPTSITIIAHGGIVLNGNSGANTLLDGLVGFWRLNETSGTHYDSVGTNHLTALNSPGYDSGKFGNATTFISANYPAGQYLSSSSNELQTGTSFSVACWVNFSALTNTTTGIGTATNVLGIVGKGVDGARHYEWALSYLPQYHCFNFDVANSDLEINDTLLQTSFGSIATTGTWYFLCVTFDYTTSQAKFFINGTIQTKTLIDDLITPIKPVAGSGPFQIGRAYNSDAYNMSGKVDNVGFWKRVLTLDEINDLYSQGGGFDYDFAHILTYATGEGGALGGGAIDESKLNRVVPMGGAVLGGNAIRQHGMIYTPTGGVTCNGTYSRSPLMIDLAAHWRLNETSGIRYDDYSDSDLTPTNAPGYTTGIFGNAARFVSLNNQYLTAANNENLYLNGTDFTIACWVKFDTFTNADGNDYIGFIGKGNPTGNNNYAFSLHYRRSFGYLQFGFANNSNVTSSVTAVNFGVLSTGVWYFVLASYEASTNNVTISVNDIENFAHSPISLYDGGALYGFAIGKGFNTDRYNFDGSVDSVSLWKRLLTDEEKMTLYNYGSGYDYLWDYVINIPLASGGIRCGGTSVVNKFNVSTLNGSGGAIVSGHGTTSQSPTVSGGIVVSGKARQTFNQIASGGATSGSSAISKLTVNYLPLGGALAVPNAQHYLLGVHGIVAKGGILGGGKDADTLISTNFGTGGALGGGSIFLMDIIDAIGGAKVGNSAVLLVSYNHLTSAGVVLSGSGVDEQCIANHLTSTTKTVGSGTNNSTFFGTPTTYVFNSPNAIIDSDDVTASAIMTTSGSTAGWLLCTNFDLDIPNGATINSITFNIERSASVANRIKDSAIRIVRHGAIVGANKANTATFWTTSDLVRTYGGDLWGTTWSSDDFDSSFGLAIKVTKTGGDTVAAMVDQVTVTVSFTGGFTNCVININGSGGVNVGGAIDDAPLMGGCICSGTALVIGGKEVYAGHGGMLCGGTCQNQVIFNTPSYNGGLWGGAKANSTTFYQVIRDLSGIGGGLVAPKNFQTYRYLASGTGLVGGTADVGIMAVMTGGINIGGNSVKLFCYKPSTSGGVKFGSRSFTSIGDSHYAYDERMFGGIKLGGISKSSKRTSFTNKISLLGGGSSSFVFTMTIIPQAGIILGSSSLVNTTLETRNSGGIVLAGIAPIYEDVTALGGSKITGSATSNIFYQNLAPNKVNIILSGNFKSQERVNIAGKVTAISSGTSPSYRLVDKRSSGGVILTGRATQTYNQIISGGGIVSGVTFIYDPKNVISEGGAVIAPYSLQLSNWHINGIGGTKINGQSRIQIIRELHHRIARNLIDLILRLEQPEYQKLFQITDGPTPLSDSSLPRNNDNSGWCYVDLRCKEGAIADNIANLQGSYLPTNKVNAP